MTLRQVSLLLPALLLYLKTWSDRIRVAAIVGVFQVATALRWLIADDRGLAHNILGSGSLPDHWGIGLMLRHAPGAALLSRVFDGRAGRYGLILLLVLIAVALNRRARMIDLFRQTGVLLLAFVVFTPGFGIQYLAWLTPWMVVLPVPVIASYVAASSVFCAAVLHVLERRNSVVVCKLDRDRDLEGWCGLARRCDMGQC